MPDALRPLPRRPGYPPRLRGALLVACVSGVVAACNGARVDLLEPRCATGPCDGGLSVNGDGGALFDLFDGGWPRLVVSASRGPVNGLVAYGDSLYAGSSQGIVVSAKDGSRPVWVADGGGISSPSVFAVSPGGVYWANDLGVHAASLDGSGYRLLAPACGLVTALGADDTQVTWQCGTSGGIRRANLDGTDQRELIAGGVPTVGAVGTFASDETWLFWTATNSLRRARKDGSNPILFLLTNGTPAALAVDDGWLYFVVGDNAFRIDKARTQSSFLAPSGSRMTLDADRLYLSEPGSVISVAKTGGDLQLVALGSSTRALAVDAQAVYVAEDRGVLAYPK